MIIPVAALLLLLLPGLLGGRLRRLSAVPVRHGWLMPVTLAVQVAALAGGGPRGLSAAAHVGTYVVAGVFVLLNRQIPWLWLIALGGLSNGVTIALNGGELPARAGALRTAGLDGDPGHFVNSGLVEHPRLAFLGDVLALPSWFPLANVFSVGDVLMLAGVALASLWICGTRWTRPLAHWADGQNPHDLRVRVDR